VLFVVFRNSPVVAWLVWWATGRDGHSMFP